MNIKKIKIVFSIIIHRYYIFFYLLKDKTTFFECKLIINKLIFEVKWFFISELDEFKDKGIFRYFLSKLPSKLLFSLYHAVQKEVIIRKIYSDDYDYDDDDDDDDYNDDEEDDDDKENSDDGDDYETRFIKDVCFNCKHYNSEHDNSWGKVLVCSVNPCGPANKCCFHFKLNNDYFHLL